MYFRVNPDGLHHAAKEVGELAHGTIEAQRYALDHVRVDPVWSPTFTPTEEAIARCREVVLDSHRRLHDLLDEAAGALHATARVYSRAEREQATAVAALQAQEGRP